jgi:hypothetical protein
MAETKNETKKKPQVVVPGLMRGLNKKVTQGQGGGVPLPTEAPAQEPAPVQEQEQPANITSFAERVEKYTGVKEQGQAIWVPAEVKKELEMIRIKASKNIPLRSLAAAMIMAFISEHPEEIEKL